MSCLLIAIALKQFQILSFLIPFVALALATSNGKMEKKSITNLVVSIAMEQEASPLVSHLKLKEDEAFFPSQVPFKAFRGTHGDCKITVVTPGKDVVHGTGVENVGTVPAAVKTFLALQKLEEHVDLLINAGTCGGFRAKGAEIGDVFLTTASANHDRRIAIPSYTEYGIGRIDHIETKSLAAEIGAKTGVCTTGNSLDMHEVDEHHIKNNDASVKDMEAAAIAWSCSLFDVPHFGVKVVTDIVDGDKPTEEEFMENLHTAAVNLQETLPKVIDHVCGKGHDEL